MNLPSEREKRVSRDCLTGFAIAQALMTRESLSDPPRGMLSSSVPGAMIFSLTICSIDEGSGPISLSTVALTVERPKEWSCVLGSVGRRDGGAWRGLPVV